MARIPKSAAAKAVTINPTGRRASVSNYGAIPYRDSKLTHYLKECFGGNALVSLILFYFLLIAHCGYVMHMQYLMSFRRFLSPTFTARRTCINWQVPPWSTPRGQWGGRTVRRRESSTLYRTRHGYKWKTRKRWKWGTMTINSFAATKWMYVSNSCVCIYPTEWR